MLPASPPSAQTMAFRTDVRSGAAGPQDSRSTQPLDTPQRAPNPTDRSPRRPPRTMRAPPRAPRAPIGRAAAGRAARETPARVRGAGRGGGGALCAAVNWGLRGAGRDGRREAGGGMEELSSVGEQVFAAECILSKRLRKVRAPLPGPRVHPALCAAHRPLLCPRRASWSTWSSGAAGPPSESPVRAPPGLGGNPPIAGPGGKSCGSGPRELRPTGAALCLPAHGEGAGRPPTPSPSGRARYRAARFWRPFVACAPALELAAAGAGRGPPPLAQVILL